MCLQGKRPFPNGLLFKDATGHTASCRFATAPFRLNAKNDEVLASGEIDIGAILGVEMKKQVSPAVSSCFIAPGSC